MAHRQRNLPRRNNDKRQTQHQQTSPPQKNNHAKNKSAPLVDPLTEAELQPEPDTVQQRFLEGQFCKHIENGQCVNPTVTTVLLVSSIVKGRSSDSDLMNEKIKSVREKLERTEKDLEKELTAMDALNALTSKFVQQLVEDTLNKAQDWEDTDDDEEDGAENRDGAVNGTKKGKSPIRRGIRGFFGKLFGKK